MKILRYKQHASERKPPTWRDCHFKRKARRIFFIKEVALLAVKEEVRDETLLAEFG